MTTQAEPLLSVRPIANGNGWRISALTCQAGPNDRGYEEYHDWHCIAAVLDGIFTYRSTQGRALLTPGSLLLGNDGACFECGHEHSIGDRCIAFHFDADTMADIATTLKGSVRTTFYAPRLPPIEALLPVLAQARTLDPATDPLRAEDLALEIAARALTLDLDIQQAPVDARDERRVARAIGIIRERYAEPLTISELAALVGLGRRRFATTFRQTVGVTPYNYILNLRLAEAARRLRQRDGVPVIQIALDAGFGDLSEFTRRFHARFGLPPARYRDGRPVTQSKMSDSLSA